MSQSILQEAEQIVHGARRQDYGSPLENHSRTAALWNAYLSQKCPGINLTAEDVCMLNVLQKCSRAGTTGKITRDTLVDIAGYAANVELVQADRAKVKDAK